MEAIYAGGGLVLYDESTDADYQETLNSLKPLNELVKKYQGDTSVEDQYFIKEFLLWALAEHHKLGKDRLTNGFEFKDLIGIL
jgi:magnesium chelatase subunit I